MKKQANENSFFCFHVDFVFLPFLIRSIYNLKTSFKLLNREAIRLVLNSKYVHEQKRVVCISERRFDGKST